MTWHDVYDASELSSDQLCAVTVSGTPVVLLKVEDGVAAYYDRCSHQDVPLSGFGAIDGKELICLAHGAKFCIESGEPRCAPAKTPLQSYPARIFEGRVQIKI